jgi:phosphatidylinositol glycan class B
MMLNIFSKKNILIFIVAIATVVYITTAFNSHGFYHADEHYQIIEFAGFKLGTCTPDELAWEFKAQIRPTVQPVICLVFLKTCEFLNINNPYNQAFVLRLISALFSITVIFFFIQNTKGFIKNKSVRTAYYLLSFFLWFIPMISVRFSSETWSGLFFLLSLTYFLKDSNDEKTPYKIGILFGISFLFRFQIAFAVLGFGLWLICINHSKLKYLLKICIPFCATLVIGFLLDSWFYGEFVFTPWNYFYKNIIEGAAAEFGTAPWYYYILKLLSYPSYVIGIPIFLSFIILLIKNPRNYILWISIPFIACHSMIAHKEERFLFPIVYFFPLMLIESYLVINKIVVNCLLNRVLNYLLIVIFVSVNTIGIIAMGQKSAGIGRMGITKHIHDRYGNKNINLIFCSWANPYDPWHYLPVRFYLEDSLTEHRIDNLCELNDSLFRQDAVNLLVIRKFDKENIQCSQMIENNKLIFETQSVPKWIEIINSGYRGFDNCNILELYRYSNR